MSNNENNFNPDCAEDERDIRPAPIRCDEAKPSDNHRHSITIGEAMKRSMNRIDNVFKDSWKVLNNEYPKEPLGVRLMRYHSLTVETIESVKPALRDIVMSQIHTSIVPLLSAEERAELDRTTLDNVVSDMANSILK